MIYELGHFSLILALAVALVQAVLPLAGAQRNRAAWMAVARPAARAQCLFLVVAYACLTHAFVVSDFSVALAANHSNTALPLVYRITAVWGNHEGSPAVVADPVGLDGGGELFFAPAGRRHGGARDRRDGAGQLRLFAVHAGHVQPV
jgi:hypothetical protein